MTRGALAREVFCSGAWVKGVDLSVRSLEVWDLRLVLGFRFRAFRI